MTKLIFEAHSTTFDNEAKISSGWNDVDLSELGHRQSVELGERYKNVLPDAIYCSDLQRSYKSAAIAFKNTGVPIFIDKRLRECDYGELTQAPKEQVDGQKLQRVNTPFPGGESYNDTLTRMESFLKDVKARHDGQTVAVIGHRATQYGLEVHILGKGVEDVVTAHWSWQPGWEYEF